jgi:hypothetical protein
MDERDEWDALGTEASSAALRVLLYSDHVETRAAVRQAVGGERSNGVLSQYFDPAGARQARRGIVELLAELVLGLRSQGGDVHYCWILTRPCR